MLTADKVAAAIPKPGEQPVVHLLGGSGGSGKGWYTSPKGTVKLDNAIYLNSDDVKAALPGYEGWNASLLHEESSEVSRTIEGLVRTAKLNVVIDGTMGNPEMLEKRIAQYKAVGYRVEGHFMRVTPETSVKRALERFVRGSEAARKANPGTSKTGRFVLPDVIFSNKATQSFARMRDKMDNWEIYDNEGTSPVFVESKSRPKK
jgi:predicted ABC-type ATPase